MIIKCTLRKFAIVTVFTFIFCMCAASAFSEDNGSRFINHFDKNSDGKVSRDEFKGKDEKFDRHDNNQDGYIDASEAPNGRPQGKGKRRNFVADFDKDGDDKVSKDEFPGPDDHFDRFDKDGDGYLTADEAPKGLPRHSNRSNKK